MKVKDLIARLQKEDPEAEIHLAQDKYDYVQTTLVLPVRQLSRAQTSVSLGHTERWLDEEGKAGEVLILS